MKLEIKICGLTNIGDALKSVELGADYLGFVLYPESPRFIDPAVLKTLISDLPGRTKTVGVFVNALPDEIIRVVKDCNLTVIQLHGDEDLRELPAMPAPVWKAVRIRSGTTELPPDARLADRIVLDTSVEGLYGGTGKQIDVDSASAIAAKAEVMLGGGMNPENIAEVVSLVKPVGVDVSSGVEASPGIKDHARLAAFIRAARSAPPLPQ